MRSVPNKSANKTGISKYQHPKHKPYAAEEQPIRYHEFADGIRRTAVPAPKMLEKRIIMH